MNDEFLFYFTLGFTSVIVFLAVTEVFVKSLKEKTLQIGVIYSDESIKQAYSGELKQYQASAGFDLRALLKEDVSIKIPAGECVKVGTGLKFDIPYSHWMMITPRSGLGSKGLVLGNLTGVIDPDYQGEIILPLYNRTSEDITILEGDRVAQGIILPRYEVTFKEIESFSEESERGSKGFGSSGKS